MEYNAFNHAAWNPLHSIMLHGIHCIQSCCMESTAFNRVPFLHAAWHTLHSNTLHGIQCIQSRSIGPRCMESSAFNRDPLGHAAWNPLHSIGMLWAMLDNIHCIQSGFIGPRCLESTAFNHAAWNPCTTATAMPDPSCVCNLHHSSQQHWKLNLPNEAR